VTSRAGGWQRRLWNSPTLRFFGKYSYGMYVTQNLLKATFAPEVAIAGLAAGVGAIFWGRLGYFVLMSLGTVVAALVSWHVLEKHFLRMKSRFE
jgi:peptidoglycan/LPS O-acetylase OafA/YrhL